MLRSKFQGMQMNDSSNDSVHIVNDTTMTIAGIPSAFSKFDLTDVEHDKG